MSYEPLKGQNARHPRRSGIGLGVARALGAAGADVVVNDVTAPPGEQRGARLSSRCSRRREMTTRYFWRTSEDLPRGAALGVADHSKAWLGA